MSDIIYKYKGMQIAGFYVGKTKFYRVLNLSIPAVFTKLKDARAHINKINKE